MFIHCQKKNKIEHNKNLKKGELVVITETHGNDRLQKRVQTRLNFE